MTKSEGLRTVAGHWRPGRLGSLVQWALLGWDRKRTLMGKPVKSK
jgi:hypothetical protein